MKIIFLVAFVLLLSFHCAFAQTEVLEEAISVETNLVIIDVIVREKESRKLIGNLRREDFVLLDEGQKQEIAQFSQDKSPLSVVLLLDVSRSMDGTIKTLQDKAVEALAHLKPEDEVAVVIFAGNPVLIESFTNNRKITVDAIAAATSKENKERVKKGSYLTHGIYESVKLIAEKVAPAKRPVILAITDNISSSPAFGGTHNKTSRLLYETGATVCGLIVADPKYVVLRSTNLLFSVISGGGVNNFAGKTGGEVFAASEENAAQKLAEMFDRLRSRYTLGYEPTGEIFNGKFRRLELTLSPSGLAKVSQKKIEIKAKKGYFAKSKK